jgi:hypothetical protein
MDAGAHLEVVLELLGRLGVTVRFEHMGDGGGGLCVVRGCRIVFVDLDADIATRLERSLEALAACPELETLYVPPAIRELIDRG